MINQWICSDFFFLTIEHNLRPHSITEKAKSNGSDTAYSEKHDGSLSGA